MQTEYLSRGDKLLHMWGWRLCCSPWKYKLKTCPGELTASLEREIEKRHLIFFFFLKKGDWPCIVVWGIGSGTDCGAPGSLGAAPDYTKYRYISNLMCHNSYC